MAAAAVAVAAAATAATAIDSPTASDACTAQFTAVFAVGKVERSTGTAKKMNFLRLSVDLKRSTVFDLCK